jgi:hypothetical protein
LPKSACCLTISDRQPAANAVIRVDAFAGPAFPSKVPRKVHDALAILASASNWIGGGNRVGSYREAQVDHGLCIKG